MPSKDPRKRFLDIIYNVDAIQRYTAQHDQARFVADDMCVDAVERCLARISEAATKIGAAAETIAPGIPWAEVRALGNKLRHEYDVIERSTLWEIILNDLPPLLVASRQAVQAIERGQ